MKDEAAERLETEGSEAERLEREILWAARTRGRLQPLPCAWHAAAVCRDVYRLMMVGE